MGVEAFYHSVFLYIVIIISFIVASKVRYENYDLIREGRDNIVPAFILFLVLALFLGQRPTDGFLFGDSYLYKHTFGLTQRGLLSTGLQKREWLWQVFTLWSAHSVSLSTYFTIISVVYFMFAFWACYRFTPNNVLTCCVFFLGSISAYTYAVNGLRNGAACSIVLLAMTYALALPKKNYYVAGILALMALGIHKSTILPIASLVVSIYLVKSFKSAYKIWIGSIILSLIAGNMLTSLVVGFDYDQRAAVYLSQETMHNFNRVGFRWDLLIYSAMPILLGYYVIIKKGIQDRTYTILLNTYTLANAFWVMVIRANYSNRFAYLSWFMYPIVLAYPLLKLDIWGEEQGKYLRQIMLAHVGFTWFMETFYW